MICDIQIYIYLLCTNTRVGVLASTYYNRSLCADKTIEGLNKISNQRISDYEIVSYLIIYWFIKYYGNRYNELMNIDIVIILPYDYDYNLRLNKSIGNANRWEIMKKLKKLHSRSVV